MAIKGVGGPGAGWPGAVQDVAEANKCLFQRDMGGYERG